MSYGTILIAEDDDSLREALEVHFLEMGYQVLAARNGEDAWRLFKQHGDIGLLLSDVCMSGVDGVKLAALVREMMPDIPVILMTANDELATDLADMKVADEVLAKPFSIGVLDRIVADEFEYMHIASHIAKWGYGPR